MPARRIGELERITQSWLARLLASEQSVLTETANAYKLAAKALVPKWQAAYKALQKAKAAGYSDDYLSGFIWQEQRLATMLAQMAEIFEPLGTRTSVALTKGQQDAIRLATQSFTESMALAAGQAPADVTAGLGVSFPQQSFERMVGSLSDGSPINTLAERYGAKGPQIVREALIQGVTLGESPRKVAARINKALGGMYGDSSTLVRTEMLRTYRESTRATYLNNPRHVKGWIWCSALDRRTCPICFAMHGTKHPVTEPMASHPVCRCSMLPDIIFRSIAPIPDPQLGTEVFRGLDEETQRAILGPMAHEAYKRGYMDLPDLVRDTFHPQWGAGRAQRSLASTIGPQRVSEINKALAAAKPKRVSKVTPKPGPSPKPKPAPVVKPRVLKPKGTPVSQALDFKGVPKSGQYKELGDHMRETSKLIDQVHGDGQLTPVKMKLDTNAKRHGAYGSKRNFSKLPDGSPTLTLEPDFISLSKVNAVGKGAHPRLTTAHEVGHYLDQQFIGPAIKGQRYHITGYASEQHAVSHPGVAAWNKAVKESRAYKHLADLEQVGLKGGSYPYVGSDGKQYSFRPNAQYLGYTTTNRELWARSYAQYIATKSGDGTILAELNDVRNPLTNTYHATQWADDDFEPIAKAFDDLFEELGARG